MSWLGSAQDAVSLARAALGRAQHAGGGAELDGVPLLRFLHATNASAAALTRAETALAALRAAPIAGADDRAWVERVLVEAGEALEQARLACDVVEARRRWLEAEQRNRDAPTAVTTAEGGAA